MLSRIKGLAEQISVYSSIKETLRQSKLATLLHRSIRRVIARGDEISELSRLIEQNRMVVLKPWFQMKRNETSRMVVHEIARDFLYNFQMIWLSKNMKDHLVVPTGAVLLRQPLSLLPISSVHDEYLKTAGQDNRRMIRKAEKGGYAFREFNWNDYLDDIFKINVSKEVRAAGKMRGWYRDPVKPRYHSSEEQCYRKYYGIFKDESLCAYLHVIICGNCAFFKYFLGHADHLKHGIMNYLISCTVREYTAHSQIEWLNYGSFPVGQIGSTIGFRKRAGFKGYATFFDLEDDQILLKYSRSVRARGLKSIEIK